MKFPRWLSWVFVLFLAYVVYTGNQAPHPQQAAVPEAPTDSEPHPDYPAIDALLNGDRWKHAFNPTTQSPETPCAAQPTPEGTLGNYAIIDHPGSGAGAACGDAVTLRITYWNAHGQAAKTEEATLTLGEQKSLDALLVGITPGEIRTLLVRPNETIKALPALTKDRQQTLTVERIALPTEKSQEP